MKCKHKTLKRLYERGTSWTSTILYKCQDCGEILKKGFEEVKPKTMKKEIKELTKDALSESSEVEDE